MSDTRRKAILLYPSNFGCGVSVNLVAFDGEDIDAGFTLNSDFKDFAEATKYANDLATLLELEVISEV